MMRRVRERGAAIGPKTLLLGFIFHSPVKFGFVSAAVAARLHKATRKCVAIFTYDLNFLLPPIAESPERTLTIDPITTFETLPRMAGRGGIAG